VPAADGLRVPLPPAPGA